MALWLLESTGRQYARTSVPATGYQIHDPLVLVSTPASAITLSWTDNGAVHGVGGGVDDDAVARGTVVDVAPIEPEARSLQIEEVETRVLGLDQPGLVHAVRHLRC